MAKKKDNAENKIVEEIVEEVSAIKVEPKKEEKKEAEPVKKWKGTAI